jgi:hypothetical protein
VGASGKRERQKERLFRFLFSFQCSGIMETRNEATLVLWDPRHPKHNIIRQYKEHRATLDTNNENTNMT